MDTAQLISRDIRTVIQFKLNSIQRCFRAETTVRLPIRGSERND